MDPQDKEKNNSPRLPHVPGPGRKSMEPASPPRARRRGWVNILPLLVAALLGFLLIQKFQKRARELAIAESEVTAASAEAEEERLLLEESATVSPAEEAALAVRPFDPAFIFPRPHELAKVPLATRFDHPLGSERGAFSYNAQPFMKNRHLGDDLNGIGGWNSDLGDPVYASGRGRVIFAGEPSDGWGKMVILSHRVPKESGGEEIIQTVYAHLEEMMVFTGENVVRGEKLGTVGSANGNYLAHLHFELRTARGIDPGAGYDLKPLGRRSPEAFLEEWSPADPTLLNRDPAFTAELGVSVEAD